MIVVRSSDTNITLLLFHVSKFSVTPAVWMEVGLTSNSTKRYINISHLIEGVLDVAVIDALPAAHTSTGSDYSTSFVDKYK